ncbi:MAG TPA: exodeoxyribonuclease VII large subunit [Candidatus Omnitrophota bacterium]|nr:exodeoxyribonuclease VII large subunit [Candidatus Omnitrophota bacterium]
MAIKYLLKTTEEDKSNRQVFSVSEITSNIRLLLEETFSQVWIEGEITGFKRHTSGHFYFSIKDESSQLQCVMFRQENYKVDFEPQDGMQVLCLGRVSVYPVRGQYQLYVQRIEPKGVGALQLKFKQLVEKLKAEGLFDEEHKKPLPYLPERIGLVTSIDGAALRDILHVLERRFSNVSVLIYPVAVQGAGAAEAIAEAIADFNTARSADVLIVGRGGGSLEDLWAFNEEIVARAIFDSRIPVISAVGHEVDFTVADFVADLRAATPSAAAELVLPARQDLLIRLTDLRARLFQTFTGYLSSLEERLEILLKSRGLRDPLALFEIQFQRLDELQKNLAASCRTLIKFKEERLFAFVGKLEALGPLAILKRGFSATLKIPEGKVITDAAELKKGDRIQTRLSKGSLTSTVQEINLQ